MLADFSFIFTSAFLLGRVAGTATRGGFEIPHGQQPWRIQEGSLGQLPPNLCGDPLNGARLISTRPFL